ncbi:MAG: four-carbon acid sugar kinase family protein [Nitrososphaerota archaeon]|nr:four-carbon acid sugar kinase family protein [Candidatus Bathyarchaeota archaeon]MDW8048692.1 four-carbon acid sugar kinase family protein [Nitrososphaerota archaeon]
MDPLLSFYGDDFTGSMALAETLTVSGMPTIVLTDAKEANFIREHFPKARAIGIAGTSRSMRSDEMRSHLPPIFEKMKSYGTPIYIYKICSTFDSSKEIGNIGLAIEIAMKIFSPDFVPLIPAAPKFNRFTIFGNHYAAFTNGQIYRLDRHPSLRNHPVTPMHESDLRLCLSEQTTIKTGLINILDIRKGKKHILRQIDRLKELSASIIIFDCLSNRDMKIICEVLWSLRRDKPLFIVGSQELGYGFGKIWADLGITRMALEQSRHRLSAKKPILVVSGTCSPNTERQIDYAVKMGFREIPLCPTSILDASEREREMNRVVQEAITFLKRGVSVIIHSAKGMKDPRIEFMKRKIEEACIEYSEANELLGLGLGEITLEIIEKTKIRRIVICGGDTAGMIQSRLGIKALQIAKPIGIAAPLCYVYSDSDVINGLEIAFKGGQAGDIDYFSRVLAAKTVDFGEATIGSI